MCMAGQKVAALLGARNSEVGMMAGPSSDLQPLSSLSRFQEIPAFSYGEGSARPARSSSLAPWCGQEGPRTFSSGWV